MKDKISVFSISVYIFSFFVIVLRIFSETNAEFVPMSIDKPDVDPNELEFRDGKGPESDFGIKQWWEVIFF